MAQLVNSRVEGSCFRLHGADPRAEQQVIKVGELGAVAHRHRELLGGVRQQRQRTPTFTGVHQDRQRLPVQVAPAVHVEPDQTVERVVLDRSTDHLRPERPRIAATVVWHSVPPVPLTELEHLEARE